MQFNSTLLLPLAEHMNYASFDDKNCPYDISISIEPTNFILGTNIQQPKVHLMINVKVTLTDTD